MNKVRIGLVLACAILLAAVSCKTSSDTEQPLREGGPPDAADGGLGGQDGDDFRPPLLSPPRNPSAAGSDAPVDAGLDATKQRDGAGAIGGSGSAGVGSGANAGAGGAGSGASISGAGDAGAAPEDDAGAIDPPPCGDVDCLCDAMCARGIALACTDEAPLEECLSQCKTVAVGCESEQLAAMNCRANAPEDGYICDDVLWQFVVLGCETLEAALGACRTR